MADTGQADREAVRDEHARELPDREGTYDELREEATRRQERNARRQEAADEVQEPKEGAKDD